ncbi:unnamed protein product, partial [Nesidiocoris tenuis]
SNDATGFIMDLLTNQNHSLNVERWRVTSRTNNGTCAVISFTLNNSEAEALEERGGQVHFRFGKETIRVKKASGAGGSSGCGGDGEAKEIKPEVDEEDMGPSPKSALCRERCGWLRFGVRCEETYRISRNTDWGLYREGLREGLEGLGRDISTVGQLDAVAEHINSTLIGSYEPACPLVTRMSGWSSPWWNGELDKLRTKTRRLFNRAKRGDGWDKYRESLTVYNRALRNAKRSSWREYCSGLADASATARLQKVLSREGPGQIGHLVKGDGSYTVSSKETREVLMRTQFSGATMLPPGTNHTGQLHGSGLLHRRIRNRLNKLFTPERVKWAVGSFSPYKSPGGGDLPGSASAGSGGLVPPADLAEERTD